MAIEVEDPETLAKIRLIAELHELSDEEALHLAVRNILDELGAETANEANPRNIGLKF
jgi:hypothetical protein